MLLFETLKSVLTMDNVYSQIRRFKRGREKHEDDLSRVTRIVACLRNRTYLSTDGSSFH